MKEIILEAQAREKTGKESNKKLRQQGAVPAVVYKKGKEAAHIQIQVKALVHALHTSAGENAIISLKFSSGPTGTKTVIIKEIQYNPVKEDIIHVDFQEISLTEKIKVNVQVVLKGESQAVKIEGGIIEHMTKEIEVECLPASIPEKIDVNIEAMKIGDVIHVKQLSVPGDIKVLTDPEKTVVSASMPKVEEVKPPEELAGEAQEPEVLTERKPKEEETEGKEPQAKEEKKESKEK
ncbi:MAG: 50S ribosomal protein L25 [Candidatus Omnitrophica bacterium]|nr:50S ribosomal protein L25 [Candidatus Omnitrophota bacterium]